MSMRTVEYRMQGAVAMLVVACLPLFCVGYGAVFVGRVLSERLRRERRRRRCEDIREQRARQRLALREAQKKEQRGENWVALRNAKGAFPSCATSTEMHASATPTEMHANAKHTEAYASAKPSEMRTHAKSNKASNSVLKNSVFENTDARDEEVGGDGGVTGEEVARQWDRSHDSLGEMVRFGLMLLEIEGVVDSSVIMGEDADGVPVIVGRNPGVRGWLAEHCPHIGYKTAMRYKSLARKALQSAKGVKIVAKSETAHALQESLYADLGIPHCRLEKPRAKRRRGSRGRSPSMQEGGRSKCQTLIFATRVRAHDTLDTLSVQEAGRLGAAFFSLAEDIRGVS